MNNSEEKPTNLTGSAGFTRSNSSRQADSAGHEEPNFRWDDGRRRVANVPYMLPHDLAEGQRLDFQHYMLRYAFKGNYLAPVKDPKNILDVACGTGRWMFEIASVFPQANILGLDLVTPLQKQSTVSFPRNCIFTASDVADGLPFMDKTFDFVHQRLLILGIQAKIWPGLLRDLVRITRPGGWVELIETNLTCQRLGPETKRLAKWVQEISIKRGIDASIPKILGTQLKQVGLVNVSTQRISIPIGLWGGRVGSMLRQDILSITKATRPFVMTHAGISAREYDYIVDISLQEYEQYHSYSDFYVAYG
ncbi:hypothetical protein KDW_19380 [Dictyobacter vulcani]|uniref:Methyltransferase domain-containing protein n=1 Tax=Dictyobacter vulcani TaxID=2607529 RepID=A0A5J4KRD5_9CHLR|nr:methyltransferase domain-containing protein [Dictyobacter vulcani]GER87776.1 hypothetical protein KDW_19380 [Dictyobacter vulcani]